MKVRVRYIFAAVLAVPLLVASRIAYREFDERRMIRQEATLKSLDMGPLSFQDATLETAFKLIVERIHERGHPEVRLRLYSDGKQVPYFHRELKPEPSIAALSPSSLTDTLGRDEPLPLRELLIYMRVFSHSTCDFRGHDLVVIPEIGTIERFRRKSYRLAFTVPGGSIVQWLKSNGMEPRYEGETIEEDRENGVIFFGPESEYPFEHDVLHTTWKERLHFFLLEWKMRPFG